MSKKTILIAFSTLRDYRELNKFQDNYNFIFHAWDLPKFDKLIDNEMEKNQASFCTEEKLKELIILAKEHTIDGIACTIDYPAPLFVSVVANHLGLKGPSLISIINCQHKYYSRMSQKQHVPFATPDFKLINQNSLNKDFDLVFPIFVKPVKSYLSKFAQEVHNIDELNKIINCHIPTKTYLTHINFFLERYTNYEYKANYLLAENLLKGNQFTLDGYVFNGQITILGIVDSIMYSDTISFKQFDYPSSLPFDVQNRMYDIANKIMSGISYDNFLFNIEFMYDSITDKIFIIEINSRMSNQFADIYEKVDGINLYEILIDISINQKPKTIKRSGKYKYASSFVLRLFDNRKALRVPTENEINLFFQKFPDARLEILIKEGQWLNEIIQDVASYRYCLINLGAQTKNELNTYFEESKKLLPFSFEGD